MVTTQVAYTSLCQQFQHRLKNMPTRAIGQEAQELEELQSRLEREDWKEAQSARQAFTRDLRARAMDWDQRVRTNADRRWFGFTAMLEESNKYTHTAADIVHASRAYSLAGARSPDKDAIDAFTRQYREDRRLDLAKVNNLQQLLESYLAWLDRHFFFSALTGADERPEPGPGPPFKMSPWYDPHAPCPSELNRIVDLVVELKCNSDAHALWRPSRNRITIWVIASGLDKKLETLDQLLCSLSHELCHVYLELFSTDRSYSNRVQEVLSAKGHGSEFCRLYHFLLTSFSSWVPDSPDFNRELLLTTQNLERAEACYAGRELRGGTPVFISRVKKKLQKAIPTSLVDTEPAVAAMLSQTGQQLGLQMLAGTDKGTAATVEDAANSGNFVIKILCCAIVALLMINLFSIILTV